MTSPRAVERILVADDDQPTRLLTALALEQDGFEVITASNGSEALALFDALKPHLVLLDVMMPEMDGFEACRAVRSHLEGADTPILMMTGLDDVEFIERAYDAGATDFTTKPINYLILRHRVRYMLRARSERLAAEQRILRLAYYDELTNLPNRAFLKHHLVYVVKQAKRAQRAGAILSIDLDGFKRVNDTLGHIAGDQLLCAVAQRLTHCLRGGDCLSRLELGSDPVDTLARFGSDEFIVLLCDMNGQDNAAQVASRVLEALAQPFSFDHKEVVVTASIGIALFPGGKDDPDVLLQNADSAMHQAKEHGCNRFEFYSEVLNERARQRLELETGLRHAIERSEFELYYQPKLDTRTCMVSGAEALLRWRRPQQGLVPPAEFIALAEDTGLIVEIGAWVIRTACKQARAFQRLGLQPLPVAVNISARQFRNGELVSVVRSALEESGLEPCLLELEITEGTLMEDVKLGHSVLSELRSLGLRVAIDDFGTGYSSLGYLRCLPIDTLKIDRSFISEVTSSADSAAITAAIIAMSRSLRLNVVAEGVETPEQLAFLVRHGCPEVQGYLFSRPLSTSQFSEWLDGQVLHARASKAPESRVC